MIKKEFFRLETSYKMHLFLLLQCKLDCIIYIVLSLYHLQFSYKFKAKKPTSKEIHFQFEKFTNFCIWKLDYICIKF